MVKYPGEKGREWLLSMLKKAWETEEIPGEWQNNKSSQFIRNCDCEYYRAICLSSTVFKVYTKIIERRLRIYIENKLKNELIGL